MSNEIFLSICIPVFNSDVSKIAEKLFLQSSKQTDKIEIILIDDCSEENFRKQLITLSDKCSVIELKENIGRSRIRNLFLDYAKGKYLLFIDGDSEIISEDYLLKYIDFLKEKNPSIVLGGSIYQKEKPEKNKLLRWKYSIKRESKSASDRTIGNHAFKTNNFIIQKILFKEVKFDESLIGYGHEDTLFGIELKRKNIKIEHIENPVLNKHLDTNEVFFKKTENAIQNLVQLYKKSTEIPEIKEIKLIRFYEKIKFWKLIFLVNLLFNMSKGAFFYLLKSGNFTLWMFDFYKIGLFIRKNKS